MIGQKGIPARAGGIERHVEELSKELAKRGYEILVFCRSWYGKAQKNYQGIECLTTPSIRSKHLDAITHTFTSLLRASRENVDIFHIHGVGPSLLAWLPKLLQPSAKVIVTFHCVDRYHQKWNWFARFMLHLGEWVACHMADETITVSQILQHYCQTAYHTQTTYIPNGTQIPMSRSDVSLLNPFSLQPNTYLMMCSRLVQHKAAHTLIEAWKLLQTEQPTLTKGKKLAIVGGSAFTDDYVQEIKDLAQGDDSIVLTGTQTGETLKALFANAYAIVHPSESEGLPIAILEAMSYGKCVLSSDIPENRELTDVCGLTFETKNVKDLSEKMTWILQHPDLVIAVGEEARLHVAKQYDWKDIAEKTAYFYEYATTQPPFFAKVLKPLK
ncbi:hypothetical protein A2239_02570 [Candidatus Uhrbacteria bacterium RIFOXYA2_FULL_40_9]|nr:MAG: hypothetical protein A2239_02570 [Candidatus Uhrbacteria bacterium RIFOXYA2_FULL_40_9]OGL96564.1 MAG: hypothetical protein A2332_00010 [Candidatus Uhrbacteria bacterium RIFOXYB2_FULL_41_18]